MEEVAERPSPKPLPEDQVAGLIIILVLALLILAGLWKLMEAAPVLAWVIHPLLWLLILGRLREIVNSKKIVFRRRDTATQTIRAASQGRAEVVGRITLIDQCNMDLLADDRKNKTLTPFVIVDRSGDEAFVVGDVADGICDRFTDIASLLNTHAWHQAVEDELAGMSMARKKLVGPLAQVNGVFVTVSSRDSLADTIARHSNFSLPAGAESWNQHAAEKRWTVWTARKEREAGGEPVQVNVILPFQDIRAVGLTLGPPGSFGPALKEMVLKLALLIIPIALFQLVWFDRVFDWIGF